MPFIYISVDTPNHTNGLEGVPRGISVPDTDAMCGFESTCRRKGVFIESFFGYHASLGVFPAKLRYLSLKAS